MPKLEKKSAIHYTHVCQFLSKYWTRSAFLSNTSSNSDIYNSLKQNLSNVLHTKKKKEHNMYYIQKVLYNYYYEALFLYDNEKE